MSFPFYIYTFNDYPLIYIDERVPLIKIKFHFISNYSSRLSFFVVKIGMIIFVNLVLKKLIIL